MTQRYDPNDPRDDQELAEIASLLETLSRDHPARVEFLAGAETMRLIRLVGDPELVRRLVQVYIAGRDRMFRKKP
jgi:hypothetical protein